MANQLKVIKEINTELDTTTKKLNVVSQEVISISKASLEIQKNISKISTPSEANKRIKQTAENTEKLNALSKERSRLSKALEQSEAKLALATSSVNKQLTQNRVNTQKVNAGIRESAKLSSALSSEYEKQSIKLNQLIKRQRDLALRRELGRKLTSQQKRELSKLTKEIQKQQAAFLKVDSSARRFQRNIGNYPAALNSAASAARNLASALGFVGGAFLFVRVVRDALKTIRDFEKQNATLAGVLQKTTDQTRELQKEAQRLGETTVRTASEVTGLQLAYARLGFTQEEIIDLTGATIEGSIALNSSLDETAVLVGGIVNAFTDLSTTDTPRIIDALSLSTAKSALDFQKLNTALPIVSGAASALGVNLEETIALLGKLADANIDSSTAATSLRNIFIESGKTGKDFREILKEISESQNQLTAANDAFGKRAAVSAVVLSNNIDATNELNEALINARGTSKELAEKELNTLDGSLKLLRSAWEGVILGTNENNKVSNSLRDTIRSLAENLGTLISAVFLGVKAFIAYKSALLAASLQQKIFNIQLFNTRKASLAARFGISKLTLSWVNFTRVLKANALGLIVTGLFLLSEALSASNKSLSESVEEMNDLNKEFANQQKEVLKTNEELKDLISTYDELKTKTELTEEENKKLEDTITKIAEKVPEAVTQIGEYGKALSIGKDRVVEFVEENNKLVGLKAQEALDKQKKSLDKLKNSIEAVEGAQKGVNSTLVLGVGVVKQVDGELSKIETSFTKTGKASFTSTKLTREQNIAVLEYLSSLKTSRKELERQIEINEELLLNSMGLRSERQKQADALKRKIEQDKKEVDNINKQILLIPKLRAEIVELRKARLELTKDGVSVAEEDEINKIDKEIKALEGRIKAILGNKEANKKNIKALKGSISFAEKQISKLREQRSALSRNSKEWNAYTDLIDKATKALSLLKFQLEGVDLDPVGDQIQSSTQRIREALNNIFESTGTDNIFEKLTEDAKNELDQQIEDFKDAEKRKQRLLRDSLRMQREIRQEFVFSAVDGINTIFDAQIQRYEDDITANSEYYDALLDNEQLSDEQRESIERQRNEREKELRDKQKKEEQKAFLFNQALALAEIGLNLAKTITAINLAAAAQDALTPFAFGSVGATYRAANIPFAIATAAAQTATVLAQTLPQFAEGKNLNDNYEGLAIWGEKKRELKISKDGTMELSPKKIANHLTHVKKDDVIIPDANEYINSLSNNDLSNDLNKHIALANMTHNNYLIDRHEMFKSSERHNKLNTDRIVRAIESKNKAIYLNQKINVSGDLKFLMRKNNIT